MAKIHYSKTKDAASAFNLVKENITPETMAKYKVNADFNYDDKNNLISAKGSGFNLKMNFYLLLISFTKSKYNFLNFFILNLISFVDKLVISRNDKRTRFLLNFLLSLPTKIAS